MCTSRLARHCSHQMEPRNVQSMLITLAESVLRKSLIDASEGGDPDILEDNWRLTFQANNQMINLWIGKTIFTFADNSLQDEEAGSGSAADRIIDKKGRSTIEPDPFAPSSEEPTTLPLALGRIHKRLSNPEELKKLHLQHHHMTTDQFRFRTRSLHLLKSTFDLFDKIRSECEVCQAAKHDHEARRVDFARTPLVT